MHAHLIAPPLLGGVERLVGALKEFLADLESGRAGGAWFAFPVRLTGPAPRGGLRRATRLKTGDANAHADPVASAGAGMGDAQQTLAADAAVGHG